MKRKNQGRKDYILIWAGRASQLLTINQAVWLVLDFERRGQKADFYHYSEFMKGL